MCRAMSHQLSHHNENFAEGMMKMDKLMDSKFESRKTCFWKRLTKNSGSAISYPPSPVAACACTCITSTAARKRGCTHVSPHAQYHFPGLLPQGVQEVLSRTSEGAYGAAARCTACWLTLCQHLCCTGASSPGHASSARTADHASGWRSASGSSSRSRCRDGYDGHDGDLHGWWSRPSCCGNCVRYVPV